MVLLDTQPITKTYTRFLILLASIASTSSPASAGFDVTFWNLNTAVTSQSGFDAETIGEIQNPFIYTSVSALGENSSTADFNFQWSVQTGFGELFTAMEQQIRSPEVVSTAVSRIHILPTIDLRLTLTGSLTYAHTPGDEGGINFGASVRDLSTNQTILSDAHQGGNLYLLPAAGVINLDSTVLLNAGTPYRLQYVADSHNIGDPLPTGIMDSSGWINWHIEPIIPEPGALGLLAIAALILDARGGRLRR